MKTKRNYSDPVLGAYRPLVIQHIAPIERVYLFAGYLFVAIVLLAALVH